MATYEIEIQQPSGAIDRTRSVGSSPQDAIEQCAQACARHNGLSVSEIYSKVKFRCIGVVSSGRPSTPGDNDDGTWNEVM